MRGVVVEDAVLTTQNGDERGCSEIHRVLSNVLAYMAGVLDLFSNVGLKAIF